MNSKNSLIKLLYKINFVLNKFISSTTKSDKEYEKENRSDRKNNLFFNSISESTIKEFKNNNGLFNGFSLAESSVRAFLFHLIKKNLNKYNICEFGGGQSTIFWNLLSKQIDIEVITYEHDPEWAKILINKFHNPNIIINYCQLMQIDDETRYKIFSDPINSTTLWRETRKETDLYQFKDPLLKNGFYNIEDNQFPKNKIDAIVLDGPHGNGRSLAFPLFYSYIKDDAIVLIDDYHHYPFLEDLGKVFNFEVLEERTYTFSNKGWVIIKILNKIRNN
jgi:hypothetical protein